MKVITENPNYSVNDSFNIGQKNWDQADHLAIGQLSMDRLFKTVSVDTHREASPLNNSESPLHVEQLTFEDPLMPTRKLTGEQLLNRRVFNDALLVMHKGEVKHESYRNGMTATDRHVIHSCTKSLCAMQIAIAIEQGRLNPEADLTSYLPEFEQHTAWHGVSVQHVLDMQAGIEYDEDYTNPSAHYWDYARAAGYYPPKKGEQAIGAQAWAIKNLNHRDHPPGEAFVYNSCLANVLGMVLERIYGLGLAEIFEAELFKNIGLEASGYFNTDAFGFPIVEGQFNLRLRDFARVASLLIQQGKNDTGIQVIPPHFINELVRPNLNDKAIYQAAVEDSIFNSGQYKNQFWIVNPEQKQFTMLGIHGQFAWYDLNRELMIIGMGSYPIQDGNLMMKSLDTLWQGIAKALD